MRDLKRVNEKKGNNNDKVLFYQQFLCQLYLIFSENASDEIRPCSSTLDYASDENQTVSPMPPSIPPR